MHVQVTNQPMNEVFNKQEAYNQVYHKNKKKYKNNSIFVLQKPFVKKNKGDSDCMKMKKNPVKTKNTKAALIFIKNQEQNEKHHKTKNSALIRSSRGFWEETSSLFCYLCLGQWKWKTPGTTVTPPPPHPPAPGSPGLLQVCMYVTIHFQMIHREKHRDPKETGGEGGGPALCSRYTKIPRSP